MTIKIQNELEAKGYDVVSVHYGCYNIFQDGRIYLLSTEEGKALNNAEYLQHPINLCSYATWFRSPIS